MPPDDAFPDEPIRTGSPFAPGTVVQAVESPGANSDLFDEEQSTAPEVLTDGVMKYTAKGSATASLMVVFFASAAAWWFPAGGVLIAGLGCGLAVGGMFSDYRLPSAGLLLVHLGLFFASYSMAIN
ncbi:hypothetical protein LF1_41110 [Rubripirellula obstinata]|uniref:Uncharacterized protein n=1 Tax=Rubripirellula obstinata TaxID=406547 RepID=A0A5B1CMP0_9BACT|nr:hypothetical protein [Rubripirellula obstinata]KAA1261561.1 hypothetical protein LF1_41110 [Rubripirellula obstinata]